MATVYEWTKTNWFKVSDEGKFRDILSKLTVFSEIDNRLFHSYKKCDDGLYMHHLMAYGMIVGEYDKDTGDYGDPEEYLFKPIKELLPTEDDVFVLKYITAEKLKYVEAGYTIITKEDILHRSLDWNIDYDVEELTGRADLSPEFDSKEDSTFETIEPKRDW